MVFRLGFSRTIFRRLADAQSTYSVESAVAQNRLSWSSLLKSGSFFFVSRIDLRFVPVHVADRDHPNQGPANRERDEQPSRSAGLPKRVVPLLILGMPQVAAHHQRLVKEDILSFLRRYMMPFPVLYGVGRIPIEPRAIVQRIGSRHNFSI